MIFKEKTLQKKLEKDGYVVISFLSPDEVKSLNEFYDQIHPENNPPDIIDGIHMTTWCKDHEYKKQVREKLNTLFDKPSQNQFSNFRRLNNVFIVKKSGKDTTFKVHQDWNVVDENKYQSVNVWIPLHDVDETSGALWVLKGSHKIKRKIRGAGYLFPDYSHYFPELEKASTSVKLKAGEAIVFYHSIIHGSPPNLASKDRKAACFSVIPKEAPLCIYFQPSSTEELKQYAPNDEFIYEYDYLRTESQHRPPAERHVKLFAPMVNEKVGLDELKPFLTVNRNLLSFLSKKTRTNNRI